MNVGELKAKLQYFMDDEEVVLGVPKHDYIGRVEAIVPSVANKTVQGGCVCDDEEGAEDHYISMVDDFLDAAGVNPDTIRRPWKLAMVIPELEQSKPRIVVVID